MKNLDIFDLDKLNQDSIIEMFELQNKFDGLENNSFPTKPYGKGNPYHYCASCQKSVPEVSNSGHVSTCSWNKSYKRYHFLMGFLQIDVKNNIIKYFDLLEE